MSAAVLQATGIHKAFGGAVALHDARLSLHAGEIHAVMGENGSGKSTLLAILSGAQRPDSGSIGFDGKSFGALDPVEARAAGIAIVHQEPQLAPTLTIAENILMGRLPATGGFLNWRRINARAQAVLNMLDIDVDVRTKVAELSIGRRQMIEIAKGLVDEPRILLLDEATSSLDEADAAILFRLLRSLRAKGVAIAFVSHRMTEVMQLADRATVLRDGHFIGTTPIAETDERGLVAMMVGRDLKSYWHRAPARPGRALLELRDVSRGYLRDVTLTVRAGEVVGLAGLVGSGRSALMRTVTGVKAAKSGAILVDGKRVDPRSPAHAHRAGIGYVPEDRKAEGLVMGWSIQRNAALSRMNLRGPMAFLGGSFDRQAFADGSKGLKIKATDPGQRVSELSGGNQQKVVIARELATRPKVLLLDEPTRGIDVGAKEDIYAQISKLVGEGMGMLIASSELQELLGVCHRICVLYQGRIVAEFDAEEATEEGIAYWAAGAHELETPSQGTVVA
ncbi:sugar ABC transporter ATP-binding protein [Aquibium carbonis]|uniref:Sugar ABC transporter ATP-binding protein n=1 Tax=Aquibium carbonis TaxID=2495581 RepID=A0A429YUT9_9HYPH|nr:sugar ABC transporter ATP-binding protein [Aquibium carbonis]RST85219.1 sugar ABC transporter ATP-binding protein [Aquibium carbonis]